MESGFALGRCDVKLFDIPGLGALCDVGFTQGVNSVNYAGAKSSTANAVLNCAPKFNHVYSNHAGHIYARVTAH